MDIHEHAQRRHPRDLLYPPPAFMSPSPPEPVIILPEHRFKMYFLIVGFSLLVSVVSLIGLMWALHHSRRMRADFQRYAHLTALELTLGLDTRSDAHHACCIVCLDRPRSARFACGHGCCCLSCTVRLQQQGAACPLCRKRPLLIVETGEAMASDSSALSWGWRAVNAAQLESETAREHRLGEELADLGLSPYGLSPTERRCAVLCRASRRAWRAFEARCCELPVSREVIAIVVLCLAAAAWSSPSCVLIGFSHCWRRSLLESGAALMSLVGAASSHRCSRTLMLTSIVCWLVATLMQLSSVLEHCHYCVLQLISVRF